jgi:hypothetical protein
MSGLSPGPRWRGGAIVGTVPERSGNTSMKDTTEMMDPLLPAKFIGIPGWLTTD